jgi:hypothetical protein
MTLETNTSIENMSGSLLRTAGRCDEELNKAIEALQEGDGDISQAKMLSIQTGISKWSNMVTLVSGMLRAVADAKKATIQNVR